MKLFTKCLVLLLSATTLLTACAKAEDVGNGSESVTTTASAGGDDQPDGEDDRSLQEIYDEFVSNVKAELPQLVQQPIPSDRYEYYIGIQKPAGTKDTLVSEPMVGAMPFAITLLRVEGDADLNAIANEIKGKVDPRRWVCVEASYVETAVKGNVILLVMDGDNARGQEIMDAFVNG